MEPENWKAVLDVHLNGAYHVTQPAFQVMRENGYGRIIMTTSAAGLYGNFGQTNYSAAKMGLVGFMNTLKLEGRQVQHQGQHHRAHRRLPPDGRRPAAGHLREDETGIRRAHRPLPLLGGVPGDRQDLQRRHGLLQPRGHDDRPGNVIGDGKKVPTVEEVAANWEKILSLKGAREIRAAQRPAGRYAHGAPAGEGGTGRPGGEPRRRSGARDAMYGCTSTPC